MSNSYFGPVFPVLPSYDESGALDCFAIQKYVSYLERHGAETVMTTAGTCQFNLLTTGEILMLNKCVAESFAGRVILGTPTLAEIHLAEFMNEVARVTVRPRLLLCFPERYYDSDDVASFFGRMSKLTNEDAELYVHGLPIRDARKGTQDYDSALVAAIRSSGKKVVGMKEESSTYEAGFSLCSSTLDKDDFEFIVAGGSMRRFILLATAGAQSFFSGVGSLYPEIEISFFDHYTEGRLKEAQTIVRECETPVFQTFMEIGWHRSLRHAAKRLGLIRGEERLPMTGATAQQMDRIDLALKSLEGRLSLLKRKGVVR